MNYNLVGLPMYVMFYRQAPSQTGSFKVIRIYHLRSVLLLHLMTNDRGFLRSVRRRNINGRGTGTKWFLYVQLYCMALLNTRAYLSLIDQQAVGTRPAAMLRTPMGTRSSVLQLTSTIQTLLR